MRDLLAFLLLALVVMNIAGFMRRDDSDASDTRRSGLTVRTDHRTGCQYLATVSVWGESSITPRMDADGRQVCDGKAVKP